jgi:hypothetical protein
MNPYTILTLLFIIVFSTVIYFGVTTSSPSVTNKIEFKKEKINNMNHDIKIIKNWMNFFGVITIISIVLYIGFLFNM